MGRDLDELVVLCTDSKVGLQEAKVVTVPRLPSCQLLGSLARGFLL